LRLVRRGGQLLHVMMEFAVSFLFKILTDIGRSLLGTLISFRIFSQHVSLHIIHILSIDACSVSNCRNNGTCRSKEDGSTACACPVVTDCPKATKKVCGSNRETFKNECHLRVTACKQGAPIYVKKPGECCE
jgi:hypothetical protein